MPSRNVLKEYGANQYYHVYTRGVNKQPVFLDSSDHVFFLGLFERYLSKRPKLSPYREPYPHYPELELNAYCLMKNHLHLLLYQEDQYSLPAFMRSLLTSYSMYFNKKYQRVGPVFQSRYLASLIDKDAYLQHISRYIHLNPSQWKTYPYSSYRYYAGDPVPNWLKTEPILGIFNHNSRAYRKFVADYEEQKKYTGRTEVGVSTRVICRRSVLLQISGWFGRG